MLLNLLYLELLFPWILAGSYFGNQHENELRP